MSSVYIVHHVDTEGPLYEDIISTVGRINYTFGLNLEPNRLHLQKLQEGMVYQDGKFICLPEKLKSEVLSTINSHAINFKSTWDEIDEMLYRILSKDFRNKIPDSDNSGWVYNWHIMDHIGFIENARRRDMGYGNIFEHYQKILQGTKSKDNIYWHFHPIPFNKKAHISATSYSNSMYELLQIISRRLINYNFFPIVNRAAFHTIRPDIHSFLEHWIPFDASNQSMQRKEVLQATDCEKNRFGDWDGAPSDWQIYHPSHLDWRIEGNCRYAISKTLNLNARMRQIDENELELAFKEAKEGKSVYVGITNHDFREMSSEIDNFREMLIKISKKYNSVKYYYSDSVNAFRKVLGYSEKEIKEKKLIMNSKIIDNSLIVNIEKGECFGPQPYLAFKTHEGTYYHDNFDYSLDRKKYTYTFDSITVELSNIEVIAVASNDIYGNCVINKLVTNKDF